MPHWAGREILGLLHLGYSSVPTRKETRVMRSIEMFLLVFFVRLFSRRIQLFAHFFSQIAFRIPP
jgi:uncharacterized membrane protein YczE